jgi:hypothetical protein
MTTSPTLAFISFLKFLHGLKKIKEKGRDKRREMGMRIELKILKEAI